ncbi:HU family DNA-binding protein [Aestuariivita boseongensis]|uniref:HU family DNA-binding protein n=1 Tax=Aestuariivita boseongensis TaxID=1470562 RepID=UPI0009E2FF08|nr:HU family DNA-binding protein [Aestuariivita boseongensis]
MTAKSGTRATTATRKTSKSTAAKSKAKKPRTATSTATRRASGKTPAVTPKLVEVKEATVAKPALRKKELIELVVERSGAKKKDAKPAIEAALAVLGEALADGRELNLKPFGKLKIARQEEKSNGTVIVCRVRQPKDSPPETSADGGLHAAE